jgi:hypothetical protein
VIASVTFVPGTDGAIFYSEIMQDGLTFGAYDFLFFPEFVAAPYLAAFQMFEQECFGYVERETMRANISRTKLM